MFVRSVKNIETKFEISLNIVRHFSWLDRYVDVEWLDFEKLEIENDEELVKRYADWVFDFDCCEKFVTRYFDVFELRKTRCFDVEWLDVSDAIDADAIDVDAIDVDAIDVDCYKTTEIVIVKSWLIVAKQLIQLSFANWIFHENCNVYRSLRLNVSQKLDIALQLNAAHANKTTIEIVNRYSMMLSFVTIKRIE